jgi:predicted TIM-barrel fold metal-dependent hydrolase
MTVTDVVIDVDTHWEATAYEPGEHPLDPWRDRLPDPVDYLAWAIAGDVLDRLPDDDRPSPRQLLPRLVQLAEERGGPIILHPLHASSAEERVAWMDSIGIDHCIVNPGGYWQQLQFLDPADRPAATRRCNEYLGSKLKEHSERLHGVAVIDFSDLDRAVADLAHARDVGCRAFFLYTRQGRPPGDISPGHPAWDKVWSAATALGMVATIHIGNTPSDFTGWADIGWSHEGSAGVAGLVRLANTQRLHAAQNLLSALLFGGVFARFPTLTVLLEEMRAGWLPWFVENCERASKPSPALGDWPWELSGGDLLRRNVRITPLPGLGDADALAVVAALPEMCVFSSDYPHQEGNADPIALYQPGLDELGTPLKESFLGENISHCYERMGDPL